MSNFIHELPFIQHARRLALVPTGLALAGQPRLARRPHLRSRRRYLFVFDRNILNKLEAEDDARITFLHNRMCTLKDNASNRNSDILVAHGDPIEVLTALANDPNVRALYTNEDYEPYASGTRQQGAGNV